jgi:hypothetical protein
VDHEVGRERAVGLYGDRRRRTAQRRGLGRRGVGQEVATALGDRPVAGADVVAGDGDRLPVVEVAARAALQPRLEEHVVERGGQHRRGIERVGQRDHPGDAAVGLVPAVDVVAAGERAERAQHREGGRRRGQAG